MSGFVTNCKLLVIFFCFDFAYSGDTLISRLRSDFTLISSNNENISISYKQHYLLSTQKTPLTIKCQYNLVNKSRNEILDGDFFSSAFLNDNDQKPIYFECRKNEVCCESTCCKAPVFFPTIAKALIFVLSIIICMKILMVMCNYLKRKTSTNNEVINNDYAQQQLQSQQKQQRSTILNDKNYYRIYMEEKTDLKQEKNCLLPINNNNDHRMFAV